MGFSIGNDVESKGRVSFKAGLHKGVYLKSVGMAQVGKVGAEKDVLSFHFVSSLSNDVVPQEIVINELQLDETKEKYPASLKAFGARIKHIYEAFADYPAEGINVPDAKSFLEFMQGIAAYFNINVGTPEAPRTVYQSKAVDIKLIYNDKSFLGFPYFPNFIQNTEKGKKNNILDIDPAKDILTPTLRKKAADPFAGDEGPTPWGNDGGFPNV